MQQSNLYILIFTAVMTTLIAGLLSMTSVVLKPAQTRSIDLDTKKAILSSVMTITKEDDPLDIYARRIKGIVVDIDGNEIATNEKGEPIRADKVNILKNYKKDPGERQYPVFMFLKEEDSTQVEAYILPVYGAGLWDAIWGFVALGQDLNTIQGVSFGHKQETPGLGQRIEDEEIESRYREKRIYDEAGALVSVTMTKGEHGGKSQSIAYYENEPHLVDGLAGATLTAKGVNRMLMEYFTHYESYFKKVNEQQSMNLQ